LRSWLWQNVMDWWSLAHCWGWGLAAWVAAKRWHHVSVTVDSEYLGGGKYLAFYPVGKLVLIAAVAAGIGWEATEAAWIEPWLHFHEPPLNRLTDILFDAAGAWMGVRMAVDKKWQRW
jgi:hypothetical protein